MPKRKDYLRKPVRCRACGRNIDPLALLCPKCGAAQRVTDSRLCPFCGKLKDPFLDKCEECENSYQRPEERPIYLPPIKDGPTGICPNCGSRRPMENERCPWCSSPALPTLDR